MNPRVIFVGAGPVGLMTAIQAKLYDPNLAILMLEKYSEYKRKHSLLLDQDSFTDTHPDPEFQNFLHHLPHRIRTNELEDALLDYAKKLGIIIEYTAVTNCEELANQFPNAELIIGADGSHSIVHQQIFNHEYQIQKTLQFIAEIKYEAEGKTRYLNKLTEVAPVLTYSEHLVSEFVGKEKDDKTPISLRVFINEETFEAMKNATFKNPYHLANIEQSDDPDIESLNDTIQAWLKARATMAGEKRIADSERITATNLPVYASKEFVKIYYGKKWMLVGDSAFGVPYFRSLNNGILCSTQLAKTIYALLNNLPMKNESSSFSSVSTREETPLEYYNNYVQSLVKRENFIAEVKNLGVNSLQSTATLSRMMPASRVKLLTTTGGRNYKKEMENDEASTSYSSFSLFSSGFSQREHSIAEENNDTKHLSRPAKKPGCIII